MQWRNFDQANVPQNQVILLSNGKEIFFAKIYKEKILTRYAYHECEKTAPETINRKGGYLEVFLNNLAQQGVTPKWAHFFAPGE